MTNYYVDIGAQLRARRLELKRELKDIAQEIKTSESYLEAIEAGNIDSFPSTVYYNLFARSYARELGFDPDKIFVVSTEESLELEKIETLGEDISAKEITGLELQEDAKSNNSLGKAAIWGAAAVIIIFVAVIAYFVSGDRESSRENPAGEEELSVEPASEPAAPAIDSGIKTTGVAEIVPETIPTAPVLPPMVLRLEASDSSWVMVISDGDTILNRVLYADDFRILEARNRFRISAANPDVLQFTLDDTLLGPLTPPGRMIRNVDITRDNKSGFYRSSEPIPVKDSTRGEI